MKVFDRKSELVERPKNEPKFDRKNPYDRKILSTLILVGTVALVLAVAVIIGWYKLTNKK